MVGVEDGETEAQQLLGTGTQACSRGARFLLQGLARAPVKDPELRERIRKLAIPPAWTDVWIAPYANGHIQATGIDAAGRRQYIYHPTWREQMDRIKYDRMLALAESLPAARRQVTTTCERGAVENSARWRRRFRMLDTGSLRVGL